MTILFRRGARLSCFVLLSLSLLIACSESESVDAETLDLADSAGGDADKENASVSGSNVPDRWYGQAEVSAGAQVFAQNCAECHGDNAQGTVVDWKQRLPNGFFPAPPLDGSAHAWHHPRSTLLQVIDYGGEDLGGSMPAFNDVLSDEEKLSAIAYFQNFWSNEIYDQWLQMGGDS